MAEGITYSRRTRREHASDHRTSPTSSPTGKGTRECWMFVSAHDDDIVTGAGLTFQVGDGRGDPGPRRDDDRRPHGLLPDDAAAHDRRGPPTPRRSGRFRPSGLPAGAAPLPPLSRLQLEPVPRAGTSPRSAIRPRSKGPAACKTPIPTSSARSGPRGSSCPRSPTCTRTTASSTRRC